MTDTEIIIEVAKLDGWHLLDSDETDTYYPGGLRTVRKKMWHQSETNPLFLQGLRQDELPHYLTSRDAIVPVIEKLKNDKNWSSNPGDYPTWMFSGYLLQELNLQLWDNGEQLSVPVEIAW